MLVFKSGKKEKTFLRDAFFYPQSFCTPPLELSKSGKVILTGLGAFSGKIFFSKKKMGSGKKFRKDGGVPKKTNQFL